MGGQEETGLCHRKTIACGSGALGWNPPSHPVTSCVSLGGHAAPGSLGGLICKLQGGVGEEVGNGNGIMVIRGLGEAATEEGLWKQQSTLAMRGINITPALALLRQGGSQGVVGEGCPK